MKTKHLFAALALPCVFAACSQDEFADGKDINKNIPANAISGMTLNVTKDADGVSTRADWDDKGNKITFDKGDKISLYWLGAADDAANSYETEFARNDLDGNFNSIFRTEDGAAFSSESLVFEGGNIAVFPGDISFVTKGKIFLNVPEIQDNATMDNIPYISNQLWIKKQGGDQTEQLPGYYGDKVLDCPVKLAANMVNLTLDLSNIPTGYDFEIQSVELVTTSKGSGNAFATTSKVTTAATVPTYTGAVISEGENEVKTIVAQTWSAPSTKVNALKTKAFTKIDDKTVVAHFVVLPTDAAFETDFANAQIVVRTNCGTVTIQSDADGTTAENMANPIINGDTKVTIGDAIESFVKSQTAGVNSKFKDEKIGKGFRRNLAVDISKAVLTDSYVYSSSDIIRYAGLYKALDKKDALNLFLASSGKDGQFLGLTKEAVDAFHKLVPSTGALAFTLKPVTGNAEAVTTIEIVGGGQVYDIPELAANNVELALTTGTWTMDDALALDAQITSIKNSGTLTINGTKTSAGAQNVVAASIKNDGTLNIGGNNKVIMGTFESTVKSIVNIEANQELNFGTAIAATKLLGAINVKDISSMLTIKDAVTVVSDATINNWGTVASAGSTGGLTNKGVINVKADNAITYVQDNQNGIINLYKRTDEVKVESLNQGKIVYIYDIQKDGSTFEKKTADKFTYVIFGEGVNALTLQASTATIDMEFKGICTLTAPIATDISIKNLYVMEGANLRLYTGNKLTVVDLANNGTITIGGLINFSGTSTGAGRVLSVGNGAIVDLP